jgi:hypothetical protein
MHDILPGRVNIIRGRFFPIKSFSLTNFIYRKLNLNEKELNQEIAYFNGDYDEEYKNIKIPFTFIKINLKQVNAKFIEKFSDYKLNDMLLELKKVGDEEMDITEVSFLHHVKQLFQKGFCSTDNKWITNTIACL